MRILRVIYAGEKCPRFLFVVRVQSFARVLPRFIKIVIGKR
jgi:hypothetical protein